jgi:hypothetical protein
LRGALRDLDEGSAGLRLAALERLASLPPRLAAPVYAAALSRETDPDVLAHLCRVAGRCGVHSLVNLVGRHAAHPDERVRVAVLFAQRRLSGGSAVESLGEGGNPRDDRSPHVRRAVLLAETLFQPEGAQARFQKMTADPDPGFRRLLAACAAALDPPAEDVLRVLAQDRDGGVRAAAIRALGAPPALSEAAPAERRRALRRLSSEPRSDGRTGPAGRRDLVSLIERELRQSLRGLTPDQLIEHLDLTRSELNSALDAAISSGHVVRRGARYFAS